MPCHGSASAKSLSPRDQKGLNSRHTAQSQQRQREAGEVRALPVGCPSRLGLGGSGSLQTTLGIPHLSSPKTHRYIHTQTCTLGSSSGVCPSRGPNSPLHPGLPVSGSTGGGAGSPSCCSTQLALGGGGSGQGAGAPRLSGAEGKAREGCPAQGSLHHPGPAMGKKVHRGLRYS